MAPDATTGRTEHNYDIAVHYDDLSGLDELGSMFPIMDPDGRETLEYGIGLIRATEEEAKKANGDVEANDVIVGFGDGASPNKVPFRDIDPVLQDVLDTFRDEHGELIDEEHYPTEDERATIVAIAELTFVKHEGRWRLNEYAFEPEV